jgi:hypothetical protein
MAALAAFVSLTTFAVQARALTLNRAVEPPPARFASGPTLYRQTRERTFSDPFALERYCAFYLGRPPHGYYQACYIPALDQVVVPDGRAWPSRAERETLRAHEWAHEWAHARGWRHPALATGSIY